MSETQNDKPKKLAPVRMINSLPDSEKTFEKILDIKRRRLAQELTSPYCMSDDCSRIRESLSSHRGYHRKCYQCYTVNLNRLSDVKEVAQPESTISRPSRMSWNKSLFIPECIFCKSCHGQQKRLAYLIPVVDKQLSHRLKQGRT